MPIPRRYRRFCFLACLLAAWTACQASAPIERESGMNLLPSPSSITLKEGVFELQKEDRIFLPPGTERPEWLAVNRLRDQCHQLTAIRPTLDRLGSDSAAQRGIMLSVKAPAETDLRLRDGYRLSIDTNRVSIEGNSSSGLFYGLQTFSQLLRQHAQRIPALIIQDEPQFAYRGFYHDVCRGKVPTLETLKWIADYLAQYKVNMLQLYVEHTFAFRFDPEIARDCSPLEPHEILELQEYCRDRRIDLVPSLQSFGHMGHILSLPQYRHLADVEMTKSWEEMSWHERMIGATINPNDPEAKKLLEAMFEDFIPLFDSPFVNVCADETYALGEGKNKALAEKIGKGRLYLQHIEFLNDLCKKYGKRMMFWGDVVTHHPEEVPNVPKDTVLLNWGYHQNTKYENTKLFTDTGLETFVCPGVSGWNRILNGIGNADLNIRRFAAAGENYGATGLLNTDWGDHGHYNLLSGSLHGIALGAAMAWNPKSPGPEAFDRIWNQLIWGDPHGKGVRQLREMTWAADHEGTWIQLHAPLSDLKAGENIDDASAERLIRQGRAAAKVFESYARKNQGEAFINAELRHASMMNAMLGEKVLLARQAAERQGKRSLRLARKLEDFADRLETLYLEYEQLWRTRNKESNLRDIRKAFDALIADARATSAKLKN